MTIGVKIPAANANPVQNPLHQFASWTYTWTLWYLNEEDLNALMSQPDVASALAWKPTYGASFVVAEDAGLYPQLRFPNVPYNYNIDEVNMITQIIPSREIKHSNLIAGEMTIVEPIGCTLLDVLVINSRQLHQDIQYNYLDQPYMLELNFVGYDDAGKPIPSIQTSSFYRKRFPIKLLNMGIDISEKGTTYKISFSAWGHEAHMGDPKTIHQNAQITAATVEEFFNGASGLASKLNGWWANLGPNRVAVPDTIQFIIDPAIGRSQISAPANLSFVNTDPNSVEYDPSKKTFNIPKESNTLDIVQKIMSQSQYMIQQTTGAATGGAAGQQTPLNTFRVTVTTKVGAFDNIRNTNSKNYVVYIGQAVALNTVGPNVPNAVDTTNYTIKEYNYIYTGQNIDILKLKINFDMSSIQNLPAYPSAPATAVPTRNIGVNLLSQSVTNTVIGQASIGKAVSAVGKGILVTPIRYRYIAQDVPVISGLGQKDNPDAVNAAQALDNLYTSSSDFLVVDLTIVGDPTLLKQDDWLYNMDPTKSNDYTNFTSLSNADYIKKYGHARMDTGDLIVSLTINSPDDLDLDLTNQGLYYPPVKSGAQSLFSGQYSIIEIKSEFKKGVFEQSLALNRIQNQEIAALLSTNADTRSPNPQVATNPAPIPSNSTVSSPGTTTTTLQNNQTNARQ